MIKSFVSNLRGQCAVANPVRASAIVAPALQRPLQLVAERV
jgi:hypothetical protein